MKKQLSLVASALFIAGTIFFVGCSKEDTTPPVITLKGAADQQSILNATWTDEGATAEDDEDGTVTVTVTGSVNKDLTGTYTLTYSATDAAGNEATKTRKVTVYNEAQTLAGGYDVNDNCGPGAVYTYTQTITVDASLNKRIHFNKFGDYSNNVNIYADVNATTITLPSQTAVAIGSSSQTHQFAGSGSTTATGFTLAYTDLNVTAGGAAANCNATFTKK